MPKVSSGIDKDFEAEMDFDTLTRAAEIVNDKKRFDRAMKAGEKKKKDVETAMTNMKGLRR